MNVKTIFFFQDDTNGWQEVYYQTAANLEASYPPAQNLARFRAALMAAPTQLYAIRTNDDQNPRASYLTPAALPASANYTSRSDLPDTAAMARFYSSGQQRTRGLYLRGNPDDAYTENNFQSADAQAWQQAFGAYISILAAPNSPWTIKYRPRPNQATIGGNTIPISDWEQNPDNSALTNITFSGAIPGAPAVPFFLQTYNVKGLPQAPGLVKVQQYNSTALSVQCVFRTPTQYLYPMGGYAVVYAPAYDPITSVAALPRWTRRATGRPFDVTRGRRRSVSR